MTTDVAEATSTPVEEVVTTPVVPEAPEPKDAVIPTPEGVAEDDAVSADSNEPFDVTKLPEWEETVKTIDPEIKAAAAAPQMPGESVVSVMQNIELENANFQRGFMQATEPQIRDYLGQVLGLSPQDNHNLWQGALGPVLRKLMASNKDYIKVNFHESVNDKLPPEGKAAFYSQRYPDQAEAVKGVYTAGVAVERKSWEAKIGTSLFTKAQMEKIAKAAHNSGLGIAEREGVVEGQSSGQPVSGTAVSGRSFANEAAVHRAFNSNQISREQYGREIKRLTHKLPGE